MNTGTVLEPLTTNALVCRELGGDVPEVALSRQDAFSSRQMLAGLAVLIVLVSFFGLWCVLAPINGAVVARGIVQVASHRKTIQHLEGGIVDKILVRDGDLVVQGQPLIKLRDVGPAAELSQLEGQQRETVAVIGRLLAEQSGAPQVILPEEFASGANDPAFQSVIAGQQQILESQRRLISERISVLEQKKAQDQEEIIGLTAQIGASRLQRDLLIEELAKLKVLYDKQLIPRMRLLARRQEAASVDGNLGEYVATVARTRKTMSETDLQINEIRTAETFRMNQQLREERATLFDISQRIIAVRDVLGRTTIVSPIDGQVANMQVHTTDGVIRAGQPLLDISPQDDELVVQAFIDPNDIDDVRIGNAADIKLTSVTRRSRVPIEGVVSVVSPDRLIDPQSGMAYYHARIEFPPALRDTHEDGLIAGMGTDVYIRTAERSPLEYLLTPLSRYFQRGVREK